MVNPPLWSRFKYMRNIQIPFIHHSGHSEVKSYWPKILWEFSSTAILRNREVLSAGGLSTFILQYGSWLGHHITSRGKYYHKNLSWNLEHSPVRLGGAWMGRQQLTFSHRSGIKSNFYFDVCGQNKMAKLMAFLSASSALSANVSWHCNSMLAILYFSRHHHSVSNKMKSSKWLKYL